MKPIKIIQKLNESDSVILDGKEYTDYDELYNDVLYEIEENARKLQSAEIPEDISSTKDIDSFVLGGLPKELHNDYKKEVKGINDIEDRLYTAVDYLNGLLSKYENMDFEDSENSEEPNIEKPTDEDNKKRNDIDKLTDELYDLYKKKVDELKIFDKIISSIETLTECKLDKTREYDFGVHPEWYEASMWISEFYITNDYLKKFGLSLSAHGNVNIKPSIKNAMTYEDHLKSSLDDQIKKLKYSIKAVNNNNLKIYGNFRIGDIWYDVEYKQDGNFKFKKHIYK